MDLPICEHFKTDGTRCGSPAVRDQKYCYYHFAVHQLVPKANLMVKMWSPAAEIDPLFQYQMPYLEDSAALQIAFMQYIYGVSQDRLQPAQARLVLGALKGAAANLRSREKLVARALEASARKKQPVSVKAEERKGSRRGAKEAV